MISIARKVSEQQSCMISISQRCAVKYQLSYFKHNDANVMIISTDLIAENLASHLIVNYLQAGFDFQEKSKIRVKKIMLPELDL